MKQFFSRVAEQVTAIVLAALAAAAIAFFQSLSVQTEACLSPDTATSSAGLLGAMFKGAHSVLFLMSQKSHL